VASDMPATRDVLTGVRGVEVVTPGDVAHLADALVRALDEGALRSNYVSRDRQHLLDRFDWDAVALGYRDLITNVGNLSP
jgi:glycosyltransferase involved in cell wall biosynthesis